MSANQARFRVATMARVLGVSPSGYYAWRRRPPSARARADAELRARVQAIHSRSRGTYGAPRIHAELTEGGVAVSRKRVARVMRSVGVAGVSRRRGPRTTRRNAQARPAPDRVERRFEADAPHSMPARWIRCRPRRPSGRHWSCPSSARRLGLSLLPVLLSRGRPPTGPPRCWRDSTTANGDTDTAGLREHEHGTAHRPTPRGVEPATTETPAFVDVAGDDDGLELSA